ncbi:MAG: hypothetical protein ACREOZ_02800 [Gloeomargaritales cyanobacterium]
MKDVCKNIQRFSDDQILALANIGVKEVYDLAYIELEDLASIDIFSKVGTIFLVQQGPRSWPVKLTFIHMV